MNIYIRASVSVPILTSVTLILATISGISIDRTPSLRAVDAERWTPGTKQE